MTSVEINTTRFGTIGIQPRDIIRFEAGMRGLDDCRDWVLLADVHNDALGWLQSMDHAEVALAVVSPRRFVPDYQVRVPRAELESFGLPPAEGAHVLVIVSVSDRETTLNLKAPLIIDIERRLGRQVVTNGDQPLRHPIHPTETTARKVA